MLNVEDKNHKVITILTVEFTDIRAPSCIGGGEWKRVTVLSSNTVDSKFYPASDPLSYIINDDHITIGRNEICDAYLMLDGSPKNQPIHGEYYDVGWGSRTPLGYFTLSRKK